MLNKTSGLTKFLMASFICHIIFSIYLIQYTAEYEAKAKQEAENREEELNKQKEKEIQKDLEEILREIVDEKDEKKKEELVKELKNEVWEELKEKREDLLEDKKDLDEGQFLEKLADETLKKMEDLKKKQDEEIKKQELIEELVNKDAPEAEQKIDKMTENKTLEEIQKDALQETLAELKKQMEENIKPVVEKGDKEFQKKIDALIQQLATAAQNKPDSNNSEKKPELFQQTEEMAKKAEEANEQFADKLDYFKKDQLQESLNHLENKEKEVEKGRLEALKVYDTLTEAEKIQANLPKPPETNKDWENAVKNNEQQIATKKPETAITEPLAKLAKIQEQEKKAEKDLRETLKEELKQTEQVLQEIEEKPLPKTEKDQLKKIKTELKATQEKASLADRTTLKSATKEQLQNKAKIEELVKNALDNIADNKKPATEDNQSANSTSNPKDTPNAHSNAKSNNPLQEALNQQKAKKTEVAQKRKEVTKAYEKSSPQEKEQANLPKTPNSEEEWKAAIKNNEEQLASNKPKTSMSEPLQQLATAEKQKNDANKNLRETLYKDLQTTKQVLEKLDKNENIQSSDNSKNKLEQAKKNFRSSIENARTNKETDLEKATETQIKNREDILQIAKEAQNQPKETTQKTANNKLNQNEKENKINQLAESLQKTKDAVEKATQQIAQTEPFNETPKTPSEKVESQLKKAEQALNNIKQNPKEKSPEEVKNISDAIDKAKKSMEELQKSFGENQQAIKKDNRDLRNNLTEKEKQTHKEALADLDKKLINTEGPKDIESKVGTLSESEKKLTEIKTNVNAERREALQNSREQVEILKELSKEISKQNENGVSNKEEQRQNLVEQIKNQAIQNSIEKKSQEFGNFLEQNESANKNEAVQNFKKEAKESITDARKTKENATEEKTDNTNEEGKEDDIGDFAENELATDKNETDSEDSTEGNSDSDEEKSNSKNKGKGKKGSKGNQKGFVQDKNSTNNDEQENNEESDNKEDNSSTAVAKVIADIIQSQEQINNQEAKSKSKEPSQKENKGSGAKLDGGDKNASEIARNILLKSNKQFKRDEVTEEDKKRIYSQNINEEALHTPPAILFAKPTATGVPTEKRELSTEIYLNPDPKLNVNTKTTKNQERTRVKHEKYQKGNFRAIPYLQNKPIIDGKSNDWELEKAWVKDDKRIAMGWRSDGIYFFCTIRDRTEAFEKASAEEMASTWWRFDSVDLWIDMKNTKSDDTNQDGCQQFTFWPALPSIRGKAELYEILWGGRAKNKSYRSRRIPLNNEKEIVIASVVHPDNKGYDIEVFIPSEKLTNQNFYKGGQVMGFLYIINHGNLVEDSSLEFYKEGFDGYSSHPSSWGNIQLLGTDAKIEQINVKQEIVNERFVEVSTNLHLRVTDRDINHSPNQKDKLTIRVKNSNNFNGVKSEETDWEDIELTETGNNTGVFEGAITLTIAPPKLGDNAISANIGDILNVYYNDHIQVAGEYNEKIQLQVKVIPPIVNIQGKIKK